LNFERQAGGSAEHALAQHLARLAACTVLVLGDVMLDRYVLGDVRRISSEAPIPVLHAQARRQVLGGAGNVAANAAALGARAVLVGIRGADDAGRALQIGIAAEAAIDDRMVVADRPTTVKTRFMSGGYQLLRLDEEVTNPISTEVEGAVLAAFDIALQNANVVVLSDYAKGVLTDRVLAHAIAAARRAGVTVVVDPKRSRFDAYAGAHVLTPNALEVARATGMRRWPMPPPPGLAKWHWFKPG
jgi:D-beta-D-heptose 7-phosphate kinase/D-beta-D-heptose 1-phosphate adenosyltransferase